VAKKKKQFEKDLKEKKKNYVLYGFPLAAWLIILRIVSGVYELTNVELSGKPV
jgi:rRNA pseudouridine-1189 N-methylase Emg1 (Nep1/Mra1 family)